MNGFRKEGKSDVRGHIFIYQKQESAQELWWKEIEVTVSYTAIHNSNDLNISQKSIISQLQSESYSSINLVSIEYVYPPLSFPREHEQ